MGRMTVRMGKTRLGLAVGALICIVLAGCGVSNYPDAPIHADATATISDYKIGPGDSLEIFVWRQPDLSSKAPVRPDGKISVPLIEDVVAAGKTPSELGDEIEGVLAKYVQNPQVTIVVSNFVGQFAEQIRVVGQAATPQAIPYRNGMTVLDAMITAGGLSDLAAGNRSVIVRKVDEEEVVYRVRLDDLLRNGDVGANVDLIPGDVLIIPEARF